MSKSTVQKILSYADIKVGGSRPWDIKVNNPRAYKRVLTGSLGLGEAYMDGDWDCKNLDQFFDRVISARLHQKVRDVSLITDVFLAKLVNKQNKKRSKQVAEQHYDVGNDLYQDMLGKRMQYTCGYWRRAKTLEKAQLDKIDLVCQKAKLKKGETVLELGGGWGYLAQHAAKKYGCKVVSYNISKEQVAHARKICKGLNVQIMHQDYREAKGVFDKVLSVGMMEHVGYKNYNSFFSLITRSLKPGGIAVVHTIGGLTTTTTGDPWLLKYIFPGGMLPSLKQVMEASEGRLLLEDFHNFGADYDKTLMAWDKNFVKSWPKYKKQYGERFYRMWRYYLLCCAGSFRARTMNLWQFVFSKGGVRDGYIPVR